MSVYVLILYMGYIVGLMIIEFKMYMYFIFSWFVFGLRCIGICVLVRVLYRFCVMDFLNCFKFCWGLSDKLFMIWY